MTFDASEPAGELIELCDRLLDGSLTPEEHDRLEKLVIGDQKLRKLYVEYLQLNSHLAHHHSLATASHPRALSLPVQEKKTISFPRVILKAAAAIALIGIVAASTWTLAKRPSSIAVLQQAEGVRWNNCTLPTEPGSNLSAGRISLFEGLATLNFKSGAQVIVEGPAELELIDAMKCRLHNGSLVAHIPESAHGFAVITDHATLIDHGTDFGIRTDRSGNASVQVMKGEVELRHKNEAKPVRLVTQQMTSISADTIQPVVPADVEVANTRKRESSKAFAHEITSATGRGAATYVTSPDTPKHFSDTLLLLKNANIKNFLRKAVIRFDLNSANVPKDINKARLTLHFEATGYGFAALGGNARIVVYAVTDDSADNWPAEGLEWEDAPAFNADAGRVDETKAVKVGEFTMPRGTLRGPFSIESPVLLDRLRADGNRLLTLIVVRENPLELPSGVVHGFAGNRHPDLPPPTIHLN